MGHYVFSSQAKAQAAVKRLIREGLDPSDIRTRTENGKYIVDCRNIYGIFGA